MGRPSADGRREEGADFSDYLGIPWTFGMRIRQPDPQAFRSLDCAGYMRMVWGYRAGLPLGYTPDGASLPRHSWELATSAPGVVLISNTGAQVTDFSRLAPGDLVFFKWTRRTSTQLTHVGMVLGLDTAGHARFISSRQGVDGPTLGDEHGASLLDGTGLWARANGPACVGTRRDARAERRKGGMAMSVETNKAVAQATAGRLFSQGDLRVVDECIAVDAVDHNEPAGTDCREHFRQVVTMLRRAFPDFQVTIEDMIAEGDKVAARVTMTGTHQGPFMGLPPTGTRIAVQQMRLMRFTDGKMVDSWAVIDWAEWRRQLSSASSPVEATGP